MFEIFGACGTYALVELFSKLFGSFLENYKKKKERKKDIGLPYKYLKSKYNLNNFLLQNIIHNTNCNNIL